MSVIAKFRCLNAKQSWDGHHTAYLAPVCAKDIQYIDGRKVEIDSPENARFWAATPSGSAEVGYGVMHQYREVDGRYQPIEVPYLQSFETGECYYIQIWHHGDPEADQGAEVWGTSFLTLNTSGGLKIIFDRSKGNGRIEMQIENRGAIPFFLGNFLEKYQACLLPAPSNEGTGFSQQWLVSFRHIVK